MMKNKLSPGTWYYIVLLIIVLVFAFLPQLKNGFQLDLNHLAEKLFAEAIVC